MIVIVIGLGNFCAIAQKDSTVFQKKVVGDSLSFRKNVLPRFQNDSLFDSIKKFVSKQNAIVYEITGYPYKAGLLIIIITDTACKFVSGISMSRTDNSIEIISSSANLDKRILKKMNSRSYGVFERWKFESWNLGSTMPNEELIYRIENGQVTSAIFLISVDPGYFDYNKLENSFLYQVRDQLWHHLYSIRKNTK
ncbi:MAG TPA: hypothetical protein VFM18_20955 [Methanosarcina sp.]|nr:hypothetical protein [Methanosarcina sp.]